MKITEKQKSEILEKRAAGLSSNKIAELMKLKTSTVNYYAYEKNKPTKVRHEVVQVAPKTEGKMAAVFGTPEQIAEFLGNYR